MFVNVLLEALLTNSEKKLKKNNKTMTFQQWTEEKWTFFEKRPQADFGGREEGWGAGGILGELCSQYFQFIFVFNIVIFPLNGTVR